jgi:hypothetical protein
MIQEWPGSFALAERILMPDRLEANNRASGMTGRQIVRQLIYAVLLVGVLGAIWEGLSDDNPNPTPQAQSGQ